MQDRFKFRQWAEQTKTMLYNIEQTDDVCLMEYLVYGNVMQCTGLKDKNGKLIYEGDIVKETLIDFINEENVIVVKWDNLNASYNLENLQNCEREVIGNIYENPELLED